MPALREANRISLPWHFQKVACSFENVRLKKNPKKQPQTNKKTEAVFSLDKNLKSEVKTDTNFHVTCVCKIN